jgi:hypothetical protein
MELLRNHLCDAYTACRGHGTAQRLHSYPLKLIAAGVRVFIVVATGHATKALLRLLQPAAQEDGFKVFGRLLDFVIFCRCGA